MAIPHALLALLVSEPKFGLRLKEEFESHTGSVWPLNVGQVYTTLSRLERDGFVQSLGHEGETASQKLYALTAGGREELFSWLGTAPESTTPPRDEIVIKVMIALTVEGCDVRSVIQIHRKRVLAAMTSFNKLKRREQDELALALVVDAELFRLEATVRWLDLAEARLVRGARLARPAVKDAPTSGPALRVERTVTSGRKRS
jgi:DNA-binding PadR family transcriptional regulator